MKSKNTHHVGPGEVVGLEVKTNALVRVLTPYGCQVVDTWGFHLSSDIEYLSMAHNHTALYRTRFKVGDTLVSNKFNPLLRLENDTTDGFHDSFHAACSMGSYSFFGETNHHPNCEDNLRQTLKEYGLECQITPPPWNLFERSVIDERGRLHDQATGSTAGDFVELRVERDLLLIFSACRSTVGNINNGRPLGAEIWVFDPEIQ